MNDVAVVDDTSLLISKMDEHFAQYYLASQKKLIITAGLNIKQREQLLFNFKTKSKSAIYNLLVRHAEASMDCPPLRNQSQSDAA